MIPAKLLGADVAEPTIADTPNRAPGRRARQSSARKAGSGSRFAALLSPVSQDVGAEVSRLLANRGFDAVEAEMVVAAVRKAILRSFKNRVMNHQNVEVQQGMAKVLDIPLTTSGYPPSVVHKTRHRSPGTTYLSTQEVAGKLNVSRPYVIKLCESGKLKPEMITEGGHRKILATSVDDYLAARSVTMKAAREAYESASEEMLVNEFQQPLSAKSRKGAR